jgi:hypothetical protein
LARGGRRNPEGVEGGEQLLLVGRVAAGALLDAVKTHSSITPDREALEHAIGVRELVQGQVDAVRHLAELAGRIVAVVGPGGSGKTYSIGAYADAIAAAGHPVIGVATSAAAARKLGEDLGERWTGTIAMLRHHLDSFPEPLRPGTLIVVDEASMVSTADLAWLVERLRRAMESSSLSVIPSNSRQSTPAGCTTGSLLQANRWSTTWSRSTSGSNSTSTGVPSPN